MIVCVIILILLCQAKRKREKEKTQALIENLKKEKRKQEERVVQIKARLEELKDKLFFLPPFDRTRFGCSLGALLDGL